MPDYIPNLDHLEQLDDALGLSEEQRRRLPPRLLTLDQLGPAGAGRGRPPGLRSLNPAQDSQPLAGAPRPASVLSGSRFPGLRSLDSAPGGLRTLDMAPMPNRGVAPDAGGGYAPRMATERPTPAPAASDRTPGLRGLGVGTEPDALERIGVQPPAEPVQPTQRNMTAGAHLRTLEDLGAPQPHGIKKVLDVIGQALVPRLEEAIPGSPGNYRQQLGEAQQAAEFEAGRIRQQNEEEERRARMQTAEVQRRNIESEIRKREQPPQERPEAPHTVTVGEKVMQWNPETSRYDIEVGPPKTGKTPPAKVNYDQGIPVSATDREGNTYDINDPNIPAELKPLVKQAAAAHQQHVQEQIKIAAATGESRGKGFGRNKPVDVIDRWNDNRPVKVSAGEAEDNPDRYMPTGPGIPAMAKRAQFAEMHTAVEKARSAIQNLDRDFDKTQIGKLTLAMRQTDPTVFRTEVDTWLGTQELTPAQQDFVVWITQLNERALSLRNVAGMGQGSDQLRTAIQNTLPSVKSGSKQLALKQLTAFENQLTLLEKGVPGVKGSKAGGSTTLPKYDLDGNHIQ